ncbi:MAG: hypothetical protein MJE66_18180 [Proteobacteria bacterium]|nr:hypothetical protein [Pseudomonadota bacterium]
MAPLEHPPDPRRVGQVFHRRPRPNSRRLGPLLLALPWLGASACDRAPAPVSAPAPEPVRFEGFYEVRGLTTELESGDEREIAGKVIIADGEDGYTSTFSLRTHVGTPDGQVPADLIGHGSGQLGSDAGLVGTAQTRVVRGAAPGLDPKFPFLQGRVQAQIESEFQMVPDRDGRFVIEIETRPAAGSRWPASRTRLTAVRSQPTRLKQADVAAGSPQR